MNWWRSQSLQVRLATRLGTLFLLATVVLAGAFFYLSYNLADSLSRRDLVRLADELADEIEDEGGLEDIDRFIARGWLTESTHYLVLDQDRQILAASDTSFIAAVLERQLDAQESDGFQMDEFGTPPQAYFGIVTTERIRGGRLTLVIAEPDRAEQELLDAIMDDIVLEAAWILPLFILLTLFVGVRAIRSGLAPLRQTAEEAAAVKPDALSRRLGTNDLPGEVAPLVQAINGALDRLEAGFELQRRFTANAAHELRTPLTIITAALDNMEGNGQLQQLRHDVARMNRLVGQLLHVARLDSLALDTSQSVDLSQIARQTLEAMAPLAIQRGKSIELSEPETPVTVIGDGPSIEDALRNLIENALVHAESNQPVDVRVEADGSVRVCDQGKGIPAVDRAHLFDRFWRGNSATRDNPGAGLGLAIVQEIMKLHGGSVTLTDNQPQGSCFTLTFRTTNS